MANKISVMQTFPAAFRDTNVCSMPFGYDIFVGIDGTGEEIEADYDAQFRNSFVHQLFERWASSSAAKENAIYLRGPNWDDTIRPTKVQAEKAFEFVRSRFRSITAPVDKILNLKFSKLLNNYNLHDFFDSTTICTTASLSPLEDITLRTTMYPRIFLAGWSRGGAGVIHLSNLLNKIDIQVYCLLLFDAVDRTITSTKKPALDYLLYGPVGLISDKKYLSTMLWDVRNIPANVNYCYHAMRFDETNSRGSFGHCGTSAASSSTAFVTRRFFCTHGGMGGVPWVVGDKDLRLSPLTAEEELIRLAISSQPIKTPGMRAALKALDRKSIYYQCHPNEEYIEEPSEYITPISNITPAQDKTGSAYVGKWMNTNFENALARSQSPYWTTRR